MKTVVYSINGKYFLDFGIYISESKGLLDKLKPKPRKSYSWAEQHGTVVDLSKPRYEEREISLKGWIIGESWHDMKAKFDLFLSEFDKGGLARLLIEFGKELVYDVYLADGIELDKEFRDGKMHGLFTIKLKEPNPVKKVLKLVGNDLQLSFTSPDWMDINIDGINESRKGSISINKTLQNRAVGGLDLGGRNYYAKNTPKIAYHGITLNANTPDAPNGLFMIGTQDRSGVIRLSNVIKSNGWWSISFEVKGSQSVPVDFDVDICDISTKTIVTTGDNSWKKVEFSVYVHNYSGAYNFVDFSRVQSAYFYLKNIKIEKGNKATDWTPAPEDVHYITIAGKIDEIVNLQTNAEIIWE